MAIQTADFMVPETLDNPPRDFEVVKSLGVEGAIWWHDHSPIIHRMFVENYEQDPWAADIFDSIYAKLSETKPFVRYWGKFWDQIMEEVFAIQFENWCKSPCKIFCGLSHNPLPDDVTYEQFKVEVLRSIFSDLPLDKGKARRQHYLASDPFNTAMPMIVGSNIIYYYPDIHNLERVLSGGPAAYVSTEQAVSQLPIH